MEEGKKGNCEDKCRQACNIGDKRCLEMSIQCPWACYYHAWQITAAISVVASLTGFRPSFRIDIATNITSLRDFRPSSPSSPSFHSSFLPFLLPPSITLHRIRHEIPERMEFRLVPLGVEFVERCFFGGAVVVFLAGIEEQTG